MATNNSTRGPRPRNPIHSPLNEPTIAWCAGLFEGEGCFSFAGGRPTACINSTDLDVLERFTVALGGNLTRPKVQANRKPQWRWNCSGYESVSRLYEILHPYLCLRGRTRGAEVLRMYEDLCAARIAA